MSITSKIVVSALLVGISVPAFAQGGAAPVHKPATPAHSLVHKAATPAEAPKAGAAISTGTTAPTTGVAASTKPSVKPESGKTSAVKPEVTSPQVNTGLAKPAMPSVSGGATIAPKTN